MSGRMRDPKAEQVTHDDALARAFKGLRQVAAKTESAAEVEPAPEPSAPRLLSDNVTAVLRELASDERRTSVVEARRLVRQMREAKRLAKAGKDPRVLLQPQPLEPWEVRFNLIRDMFRRERYPEFWARQRRKQAWLPARAQAHVPDGSVCAACEQPLETLIFVFTTEAGNPIRYCDRDDCACL